MKKFALLALVAILAAACGNPDKPSTSAAATMTTAPALTAPALKSKPEYREKAKRAIASYEVSPELDQIPDFGRDESVGWQEVVGMSLAYFVSEPQTYNEKKGLVNSEYGDIPEVQRRARNRTRQVMVAYGIFQLGNNPVRMDWLKRAVTLLWASASRETAYRLTVPSIKKALALMPREDREDYLRILRHTSRYMATFDFAREEQYLTNLEAGGCTAEAWQKKHFKLPYWFVGSRGNCKVLFTTYGPDGKENPYRKAEAFVYRRVEEGWDIHDMKQVLDRLIADLS
ncbi:MAG: hypothetical protein AAB695_00610 [Patescibacteria group bacterium]